MTTIKLCFAGTIAALICACTTPPLTNAASPEGGMLWVKHAVEYKAVTRQIYAQATRDLPRLLQNTDWTALPGHKANGNKPPAVILDVDETVTSNADFQIHHLPYTSLKHYAWSRDSKAIPVPGVVEFIAAARAAGVDVFFVTNRACEQMDDDDAACPQEKVTIDDIREAGIDTDAEHVLLVGEKPDWGKEKLTRREFIAGTHRVIMLFGDDYGDFVFCARARPAAPCTQAASRRSRHAALETYADYWGNGWYILPNPMHGSWTTVR